VCPKWCLPVEPVSLHDFYTDDTNTRASRFFNIVCCSFSSVRLQSGSRAEELSVLNPGSGFFRMIVCSGYGKTN